MNGIDALEQQPFFTVIDRHGVAFKPRFRIHCEC
jgi:hypothetical protein